MTRYAHYLTTTQALEALDEFAYLERASAHILAGWIVKTPDLKVKVAWGRQFMSNMEHASRMRDRARALRAGGDREACVPEAWRDHLRSGDESQDILGVLRCLDGVKQTLISQYADYLARADPVADAWSVEVVGSARRAAEDQTWWMRKQLGTRAAARAKSPASLTAFRLRRGRGAELASDAALWAPIDRVPRVVRPQGMRRGEPGALRLLPIRPRSRKDTGLFLHNFLNEEFATLELIARNSYEHPEMPWAFHRDAARHSADEARHAEMFMRALTDYGVQYGDYPIYTYSYEGEYEFPGTEATPGSRRELLWRILLRQVVHEGLALDSTPFEIRKRDFLKQPELARIFGYILADEVFHAGSGVKWSHFLVGGDEAEFRRQRDKAYSYYSARLKDRRLTWGASHIREAAEEEKKLGELAQHHRFPFKMEVNIAARKQAGFSDEDISRVAENRSK